MKGIQIDMHPIRGDISTAKKHDITNYSQRVIEKNLAIFHIQEIFAFKK